MKCEKPKVIAEIGCNHKGSMKIAKELIKTAKDECNIDAVKFQKRNIETWVKMKPDQYNSPHPNPKNSYGLTYKEHREYLEFNFEQHKKLKEFCESIDVEYSTSVWDIESAKGISKFKPNMIKIPSACNTNFDMLNWLCENYEGEIHLSTGMTTKKEIEEIVKLFINKKRNKDLIIYNCVSGYPVPYEDVNLLEIISLKDKYEDIVKQIGFSGHHIGTGIDIAAYTLGANIIERHYTLNKNWKGTDHSASLEPNELKRLKKDLDDTYKALNYKEEEILDIEKVQRDKLKYKER